MRPQLKHPIRVLVSRAASSTSHALDSSGYSIASLFSEASTSKSFPDAELAARLAELKAWDDLPAARTPPPLPPLEAARLRLRDRFAANFVPELEAAAGWRPRRPGRTAAPARARLRETFLAKFPALGASALSARFAKFGPEP
ncbi:hypothetical protein JL721_13076 [Aureococcus anophagefferens]|nr:hypothetical protein JL721_13076 [Aureococcus anophagefferens]